MKSETRWLDLAVPGTLVICCVVIAFILCTLKKNGTPRVKKTVKFKRTKKGTKKKKAAEVIIAESSDRGNCYKILCCRSKKPTGPFPKPPFGLELQDPTETEVTIIWNAPIETPVEGQPDLPVVKIERYKIYARFKSSPNNWVKVGKVLPEQLEFRIKSLVPRKQYVFGVSSNGKDGESTIVESQPYMLKKDPIQPGAPTEFDVIKKTSSSMTLSWKPPRKGGYSRIHTYHLIMRDCDGNNEWTLVTSLPAFDRYMDYRITGLQPRHPYRFRVNAENVAGLGPYAETVTYDTPDIEPEIPGKPRGPIKYARISHNSITLSWAPPEHDGGRPISGYIVEFKEKDSEKWQRAGVVEADKRKMTVPRLPEDVEFVFRVLAMNDVGNSKPLHGGKVKTKLLEIPLSRRSSFRLPSRAETSRESARGKHRGSFGRLSNQSQDFDDAESLKKHLEELDFGLEAHPNVPKSDFFKYDDETSSTGNISNRHGENKTRHHQFSPLPAPPVDDINIKPRMNDKDLAAFGGKRRHSEYSPLPKPNSLPYSYGHGEDSDVSDNENAGGVNGNGDVDGPGFNTDSLKIPDRRNKKEHSNTLSTTQTSILGDLPDFSSHGVGMRHQPTPSKVAYTYSR